MAIATPFEKWSSVPMIVEASISRSVEWTAYSSREIVAQFGLMESCSYLYGGVQHNARVS